MAASVGLDFKNRVESEPIYIYGIPLVAIIASAVSEAASAALFSNPMGPAARFLV
jgi:hypothetical protein